MAWFTGYGYRKQIEIDGSAAGAQTDYQMRLVVHKGSGSDSGDDVYLNNHCRDDFNDVRFTKSDGETELDHWREHYVSGDYAVFWIEFHSIPASPSSANFYIYHDKADAESGSNGNNTFIFFDDFSGDLSKWTQELNGGSISIVSGQLVIDSPANKFFWGGLDSMPKVYAAITPTTFKAFCKVVSFAPTTNYDGAWIAIRKDADNWVGMEREYDGGQKIQSSRCNAGTSAHPDSDSFENTSNFYYLLIYASGTTYYYYSADNVDWTALSSYELTLTTRQLLLGSDSGSPHNPPSATYDNIYVANYCSPEPTWGDWGAEERLIISSDSGTGMDAAVGLSAALVRSESGSGIDASVALLATITGADSGAGTDALVSLLAALVRSDAGVGTEQVLDRDIVVTESGVGAESLGDRDIVLADQGSGIDASVLLATLLSSDSGIGIDARVSLLATLTGSDTGAGTEASQLAVALVASEVGTGAEAIVGRAVVVTDSGSGVEAVIGRAIVLVDAGVGADTALLVAILTSSDVGAAVDAITELRRTAVRALTPFRVLPSVREDGRKR